MTVKDITHLSPICSDQSEELDDAAMVTVSDRKPELALMDKNFGSCISDDDQRYPFLHLVAYIYSPFPTDDLQAVVWVAGLTCIDSRLTVYHEIKRGDTYKQCALIGSETLPDTIRRCHFVCYNACPRELMVKVHVQVQQQPGMLETAVKICEMNVG